MPLYLLSLMIDVCLYKSNKILLYIYFKMLPALLSMLFFCTYVAIVMVGKNCWWLSMNHGTKM